MAEDYIKSVIKVDGGEAVKTLKQLRDETKEYQEALLNLDKDSEEYVQIAKQININQKQINEVMSAGKKYTDDAAGSYNALVAEMANLKDAWKATADEVERAALGEKINDINDQLKDMDASIGNFQRDVGNYEKGWSGLADALGDLSKVGKDAAEGMEGFGKTLGLAGEAAAAFNNHLNKMKAVFKIGESIGKTTKGLKDYAKQTAAATKATEGVAKATGGATKATKLFGIALKGAGIGLIVSLVAALATNLDGIKKRLGPVGDRFKKLWEEDIKPIIGYIMGGIAGIGTAFVEVFSQMFALVDALKEYWRGFFEWCGNMFTTLKNAAEVSQKPGGFLAAATVLVAGFKKADAEASKSMSNIADHIQKAFSSIDLKGAFKEGYDAGKAFIDGLGKGTKQEKGDKGKAEIKVPVVIDWSKLATSDEFKKRFESDSDIAGIISQRLAEIYKKDFAQQLIDLENERERVLADLSLTEEQKLALIELYGEEEEKLREKINEQISADFNKSLDEQLKAQKEHLEAEKKLNQQRADGYGYIGDILGNLGDLFEKDTIAYKAFAISQALISTYLAGTRVMAEEMGPAWVKIAAMAAVITAGLASVASILSVNEKGTTGGATTSAPSAAAVPVISSAPEISYTRSLTTAADEDRMNQPIYVSVTDINSVQNRVKVRDENASF